MTGNTYSRRKRREECEDSVGHCGSTHDSWNRVTDRIRELVRCVVVYPLVCNIG